MAELAQDRAVSHRIAPNSAETSGIIPWMPAKPPSSPVAVVHALRRRADSIPTDALDADILYLDYLAERIGTAAAERKGRNRNGAGRERDYIREFGLHLRATAKRADAIQTAAVAAAPAGETNRERRARRAGGLSVVSAVPGS